MTQTTRQFGDLRLETQQASIQMLSALWVSVLIGVAGNFLHFPKLLTFGLSSAVLVLPFIRATPFMRAVALGTLVAIGLLSSALPGLAAIGLVISLFMLPRLLKSVSPQAVEQSRAFGSLEKLLPDWEAFLPTNQSSRSLFRVLRSPSGHYYFLGLGQGSEVQQHGQTTLEWMGASASVSQQQLKLEPAHVHSAKKVTWVQPPKGKEGVYAPQLEHGVTILYTSPEGLVKQLQDWEKMYADQAAPAGSRSPNDTPPGWEETTKGANQHADPAQTAEERERRAREEGKRIEAEAQVALRQVLPAGWLMETGVILLHGGDGDIVLTLPQGQKFVIDVKSRTDHMNLNVVPVQNRRKSWADIHQQVSSAARQLGGIPVIWQPVARPDQVTQHGDVFNVRGAAQQLVTWIQQVSAPPKTEAAEEASDYDILGVAPDATLEDIKAAYRQRIKVVHPDRAAGDPELREMFDRKSKRLNAAYERLLKERGAA